MIVLELCLVNCKCLNLESFVELISYVKSVRDWITDF